MVSANDLQDTHKPLAHLIRLLGLLEVAGLQRRQQSLASTLILRNLVEPPREFCVRFDNTISLHIDYVAMVPWRDRDREFDQFYK